MVKLLIIPSITTLFARIHVFKNVELDFSVLFFIQNMM